MYKKTAAVTWLDIPLTAGAHKIWSTTFFFFTMAPKVSRFSLRNLIHVTLLAPRFLENLCTCLICCDFYTCGPRTSRL